MKYYLKLFTSILFAFIVVIGLSACGTSLQKPSGLEDSADQKTAADGTIEVVKKNAAEGKVKDESKEADVDDSDLSKEEIAKEKQAKKDSSEKLVKSEKEDKESSTAETKKKEVTPKTSKENVKEPSTNSAKETGKTESAKSVNSSKATETVKKPVESKPKPDSKPAQQEKPKEEPKPEPKKNTIVHSIVLSSSEVPLPPTEMEITDGDTVLEALIVITMANKVHMDYRGGTGATAYIQGMGNVYEFDRGQGSGWMYRVNGIFPDRGAGVVPLLGGDRVEWLYTTNLGVDLGADLKPFRR